MELNPLWQMILTALCSSGFMSLIIFLIQRYDKKKDKKDANETAQAKMLLSLGHDKLICLTRKYVRRGAITLGEKSNLNMIYVPYRDMGGNGDGKTGYEECMKLPVISYDEAEERDIAIRRKEFGL